MKKKLALYILIGITITAISISLILGIYSTITINNILKSTKNDLFLELESKIKFFDKALGLIEVDMISDGEKAIELISNKLDNLKDLGNISPEELKKLANENGADEIYIIDSSGSIFNTSFEPDMNFNLLSLSDTFTNYLKSIYGKDRVYKQRLSFSTKTGEKNVYLYYSPINSNYIIEISINVKNYIISKYSEEYYNFVFKEFFTYTTDNNKYLKHIDIYTLSGKSRWSLINENKVFPYDEDTVNNLKNGKEYQIKDGNNLTLLQKVIFDEYDFEWITNRYIEMTFDFSILYNFIRNMFLFSILFSILVVIAFFTLFSRLFNKIFITKVEKIYNAITEIEKGNYEIDINIKGDDELSIIANSINNMSKLVAKKVKTLEEFNEELDRLVIERTSQLIEANKEVVKKNEDILDSIRYAERIQISMLPDSEIINSLIPCSFYLRMPKDIVGGDGYYLEPLRNGFYIALFDCTGHGVPGAMMSMVATVFLRRIIVDYKSSSPSAILKQLNKIIKQFLKQNKKETLSDDGLDAAVCFVNLTEKKLIYAGAHLSIYYNKNGEIIRIKGDRQSIGYKKSKPDFNFTEHEIQIKNDSVFYLTTDGYLDQIGGEKNIPYGRKRFTKLLTDNQGESLEKQCESLKYSLKDYMGEENPQVDDITVIGFKV